MKRILLVSALLCLCAAPVFGITANSRITGTVKDPQGAVVPGVKITVIDTATKTEHAATTNDNGAFLVSDVRPGTYLVVPERNGFKKLEVRDVVVTVEAPVNEEKKPMSALELEAYIINGTIILLVLAKGGRWVLAELQPVVIEYQKLRDIVRTGRQEPKIRVVPDKPVSSKPSPSTPSAKETRSKAESDLAA